MAVKEETVRFAFFKLPSIPGPSVSGCPFFRIVPPLLTRANLLRSGGTAHHNAQTSHFLISAPSR